MSLNKEISRNIKNSLNLDVEFCTVWATVHLIVKLLFNATLIYV